MDEPTSTTVQYIIDGASLQSTLVSVDQELLRRAIAVAEAATENAAECLQIHDNTLGRTTRKNKAVGDLLERDVEEARRLMRELRSVLRQQMRETRENS